MPTGVYPRKPMSEEQKKLLSSIKSGVPLSDAHKEALSKAKLGKRLSEEHKKAIGKSLKGHILSEDTKLKIGRANRGLKRTPEYVKWWVENIHSKQVGDKSPNYRGGTTSLAKDIREIKQYDDWRHAVYERDNFTCQKCGKIGGRLNAHHEKAFAKILHENGIKDYQSAVQCEELWDINNGITLCANGCHIITRRGQ